MKNYLCLIIWLLSLLYYGDGQRVGNPDDTAEIERPCPKLDILCIRKFFVKHGHCKKVIGPTPDPLYRPQNTLYISRVNLTITRINEKIINTNGIIKEFYINRDSDKLVIAVEFQNQTHSSSQTYFRFHRRSKEPVVTFGSFSDKYESFIVTAVIPKIDNLQLKRAVCTTFSKDADNSMSFSPSLGNSIEPQVQQTIKDLKSDVPTVIQEILMTDSQFHITSFIQYNICDFGVKIT